jgi:hypothetical protein
MTNEQTLSSTQIGAIAENLVASLLIRDSSGRLSPFWAIADDDGIDLLVYDKKTGRALPIQVKSRTKALKKRGTEERGNVVHFEVRDKTIKSDDFAHLVAILLSDDLAQCECAWFLPLKEVIRIGAKRTGKYVIRPNRSTYAKDKFVPYRCLTSVDLVKAMIRYFDSTSETQ